MPSALFGVIHHGADSWVLEEADVTFGVVQGAGAPGTEPLHGATTIRHTDDIDMIEVDFGSCQHTHGEDSEGEGEGEYGAGGNGTAPHGREGGRARRAGAGKGKTQCSVFLDADKTFFDQWKGACSPTWSSPKCTRKQVERVTVKMVDVLHQTDEIYRKDPVVGKLVTLVVAGTHVQTARASGGLPDMRGKNSNGKWCPPPPSSFGPMHAWRWRLTCGDRVVVYNQTLAGGVGPRIKPHACWRRSV